MQGMQKFETNLGIKVHNKEYIDERKLFLA